MRSVCIDVGFIKPHTRTYDLFHNQALGEFDALAVDRLSSPRGFRYIIHASSSDENKVQIDINVNSMHILIFGRCKE